MSFAEHLAPEPRQPHCLACARPFDASRKVAASVPYRRMPSVDYLAVRVYGGLCADCAGHDAPEPHQTAQEAAGGAPAPEAPRGPPILPKPRRRASASPDVARCSECIFGCDAAGRMGTECATGRKHRGVTAHVCADFRRLLNRPPTPPGAA